MNKAFRIDYDYLYDNVPDSVYRWLENWVGVKSDQTAFVDHDGKDVSYGNLLDLCVNQASKLLELGVESGDRIAVLAGNSVQQIGLIVACSLLKCTLVPLNWRLQVKELAYNLSDSAPLIFLYDSEFENTARELNGNFAAMHLDELENPGKVLTGKEIKKSVRVNFSAEEFALLILYTSGTTGVPKGAMISERQVWQNSINTLTSWGLGVDEKYLLTAPLFHTGGWNVLTLPLLMAGCMTVVMKGFDADRVLTAIPEYGITVYFGVPTMFQMVVDSPLFSTENLKSLKLMISGGAPCPPALIEKFHVAGVGFRQGYGLTEVGPNCFSIAEGDVLAKPGSVGFPMAASKVKILGEDGDEVSRFSEGELAISGEHVCMGYFGKPEETKKANPDGYFRTGDYVKQDEDGYFYIVGRKKEMFISGGENVYPQEVESKLSFIEDIREAAVVGVPDPKWGEVGLAAVSLADGKIPDSGTESDQLSQQIRKYLKEQIASYKVPKKFVFYSDLPKNAVGKIDKNVIKTSFLEK